jgi:hypothetical protein
MSRLTRIRAAAALGVLVCLVAPAVAGAATPGNPQVLGITTSGAATVLAGGAPWSTLGGIAVDGSNDLFVANQGQIGPNPVGAGIYTLPSANTVTPPTAFTPLATAAPTTDPVGVTVSGSTLYSFDGPRVLSMGTTAPVTQTVLSSGQLYDSLNVDPEFGAVAGSTLYTTASSTCQSAEGGAAYVVGVNTTTGAQTQVANLQCAALGGVAVEAAGTLLVAETDSNSATTALTPQIVRVNPATGSVTTVTKGNLLKAPQGIAYAGTSTLYVADAVAGIVQVNPATGQQSAVAKPGGKSPLGNAYGIAYSSTGNLYVSEAGVPPTGKVTAASTQKLTSTGVKVTVSCSRTCTLGYTASYAMSPSYGISSAFTNVTKAKSRYVNVGSSVTKRIAAAIKKKGSVTVSLAFTPTDPNSGAAGTVTKLKVRLVK